MACIFSTICTKSGPDRVRGLLFGLLGVGGANRLSPLIDSVCPDELQANSVVGGDEI